MDWGLGQAARLPRERADPAAPARALTPTRSSIGSSRRRTWSKAGSKAPFIGTPSYMAPEQARGEISSLDQRADVYSLGAILYHMLTLRCPYQGNVYVVLEQVSAGELVPPRQRRPEREIPWELEALVLKAMAHDPDDRYQDVGEMLADLERYLSGRLVSAASYNPLQTAAKWVGRNRTAMIAVTVVLAVLYAAVVLPSARARAQRAEWVERARGLGAERAAHRGRRGLREGAAGRPRQRRAGEPARRGAAPGRARSQSGVCAGDHRAGRGRAGAVPAGRGAAGPQRPGGGRRQRTRPVRAARGADLDAARLLGAGSRAAAARRRRGGDRRAGAAPRGRPTAGARGRALA